MKGVKKEETRKRILTKHLIGMLSPGEKFILTETSEGKCPCKDERCDGQITTGDTGIGTEIKTFMISVVYFMPLPLPLYLLLL